MSDHKHLKETLTRLHAELVEVQATCHAELKAASKFPYPLNPCIFEIANILAKLNQGKTMLKITEQTSSKGKVDAVNNLTDVLTANTALEGVTAIWKERGRTLKNTGAGFIIEATDTDEQIEYKIELQGESSG